MPRIDVMRRTVLNHMIHHRAQLGVYLRLNEVAIPSMYGPSAARDDLRKNRGRGSRSGGKRVSDIVIATFAADTI
jgi:hypothetical protein